MPRPRESPQRGAARRRGLTLIELMIVVSVIGILAAIAIPRFAALIRKANEGSTKGNLGALRSALSIYYGDMEGCYPIHLNDLTVNGKYLSVIPNAKTPPYHPDSNNHSYSLGPTVSLDTGQWGYDNVSTDAKGTAWTAY